MDIPAKIGIIIGSTAGAIPVKNEKGQVSMQKVKVQRYVTGKRPDYAPSSDDDLGSDDEFVANREQAPRSDEEETELTAQEQQDPRLQRLLQRRQKEQEERMEDSDASDSAAPRRRVHAPEVMEDSDADEADDEGRRRRRQSSEESSSSSEDSEEDLDDEEVLKKREMLRERAMAKAKKEEELMEVEEEKKSEDEREEEEEDSSEYEEYTDSEEETGPRLKPVFVRKQDRITVQEKEKLALKAKQMELESKKAAEERRRDTLKMVESDIRAVQTVKVDEDPANAIDTDDGNDEADYEIWKLRELKRIKRDKEERDALEKERGELERLRNMTEEERRTELRNNPKQITNKASKGKYKFLQKYFHRGAFFMDEEEGVYKRDFSQTTLEDRFDKTVLPKVMQVKNFGRSGRTKYTHLVEQDTTSFDSAWAAETAQNAKFFNVQAGGVKQVFEKPSLKKKRTKT